MNVYPLALRDRWKVAPPHWLQALLIVLCILLDLATAPTDHGPQGADGWPSPPVAARSEGTD
jgi:hypothetical protein